MIYLDNAATTKPMDFLKNFYIEYQDKYWFNPSSIYYSARTVKKEIEKTREIIANIFDISPENMFFTFSGTYSNNLILNYNTIKNISKKFTGLKGKPKIISGIWEHSSVVNPLKNIKNRLNNEFEVEFIDLKEIYKTIFKGKNNFKNLITEKILNSIDENTILVSIMWIHNETGLIFPVKEISEKIKSINKNIFIHVDGTQGFMKLKIEKGFLNNIDSFSSSSHKFHSVRGAGFLYLKDPKIVSPLIYGGGQEKGITPSTENVFAILSMGKVIQNEIKNIENHYKNALILKKFMLEKLKSINIPYLFFSSNLDEFSPYINRIYIKNAKAQVIVNALQEMDIFISSGSACHSSSKTYISDTVKFGIPEKYADGALRISFGYFNTEENIVKFLNSLKEIYDMYFVF